MLLGRSPIYLTSALARFLLSKFHVLTVNGAVCIFYVALFNGTLHAGCQVVWRCTGVHNS